MDLNDFNFDAYLTNDRTLNDPEVVRVENGGRVRLRIINAAAARVFWIDTGAVEGRLVAINGKRFAGAMRDTVQVPPLALVTVAVDAGEAARWMLHCRHMPHLSTGMLTEVEVFP